MVKNNKTFENAVVNDWTTVVRVGKRKTTKSSNEDKGRDLSVPLNSAVEFPSLPSSKESPEASVMKHSQTSNKENLQNNADDDVVPNGVKLPKSPIGAERMNRESSIRTTLTSVDFAPFYKVRPKIPDFIVRDFLSQLQVKV